jgi:hypothetical protein
VAGWRNWQTQTAQNRPTARSWGFKSLARYHHYRFHSSGASGSLFPASPALTMDREAVLIPCVARIFRTARPLPSA